MNSSNPAFKGWNSCMESFLSESTSKKNNLSLVYTPERKGSIEIHWSSSSDEEATHNKKKRKKVVTRLNFDECVNNPCGQVTPLYSRCIEDSKETDAINSHNESVQSLGCGSLGTPEKVDSLLQEDGDTPISPIIPRRKRRRSLNNTPVSPIIERKFKKKFRKISPKIVDSPGEIPLKRKLGEKLVDLNQSRTSVDMITPLKLDDSCKKTSITPALENLTLNSLKSKPRSATLREPHESSVEVSISPVIEIASSQDILETSKCEDSDTIKEGSESQANVTVGMDNDELPLSAVITLSASPLLSAGTAPESGGDEMNLSLAFPLSAWETPQKTLNPLEDPESGGKRKRLKKGGLAVRLQRLLNREQSWQRMWKYERTGKSKSMNDACLILHVNSIWSETSKILLQCRVRLRPKLGVKGIATDYVILLLDPVAVGESGVKSGSVVRLHPPWQSLMARGCTTLLLCANLLEVVGLEEVQDPVGFSSGNVTMETYSCKCLEGGSSSFDPDCPFRLKLGGLEILSVFMPSLMEGEGADENKDNSESQLLLTQLPPPAPDEACASTSSEWWKQGTISQVVASHSQADGGAVCGSCLIARVQRIFYYRSSQQTSVGNRRSLTVAKSTFMKWSCLMQDAAGEFCEVEFESESERSLDGRGGGQRCGFGPWWGATYAGESLHEGALLRMSGLRILKRSEGNKLRGLPAVMVAVQNEAKAHMNERETLDEWREGVGSGQLFIYTFTCQKDGTLEILNDNSIPFQPWSRPVVQTIFDALSECKKKDSMSKSAHGLRITVLVKILFALASGEECPLRVFVVDPSLSALNCTQEMPPLWISATLKPTCYIAPLLNLMSFHAFRSANVPVLCLQDVELFGGELICDRFSRVYMNGVEDSTPDWLNSYSELMAFTRSSPIPRVPSLNLNSMPGEVVSLVGNVVGVDEETAFSWPACGFCGNDDLEKGQIPSSSSQEPVYRCSRCNMLVEKPIHKMSLDAYIACHSLRTEQSRVKVKLRQKTIMELLPPSHEKAGYELASVLGKLIGPLFCIVASSCKNAKTHHKDDVIFVLEELLCFVNIQG